MIFWYGFLDTELSCLANAVEALALAELLLDLPRALFGLFEAAHGIRLLSISEVDISQVKVRTIEILQQLTLPIKGREREIQSVFDHFPSQQFSRKIRTL